MRKQILIVKSYSGYGGIEYQIENIATILLKNKWKVFFLSDVSSPLSVSLKRKGVDIIITPFAGMRRTAHMISQICHENKIQIVQAHMLRDSFICRMAKFANPSLKHIFRVHTFIDCSHISKLRKNLYHFMSWMTDFLVNKYISINEYNVNEMCQRTHLPRRKIAVVNNVTSPLIYKKENACEFKNGKIAMIANFVDFKGHDILIEGLKILNERNRKIVAHLYGSVPGFGTENEDHHCLDTVKRTIAENGLKELVVIHGYTSNIEEAVRECGMLVLPSDAEGTPNVLLQGMMLHKVIIASEVGGVPEFIKHGETGFLHKPKNPRAFADAVEEAYCTSEEKLQEMVERAALYVENEYNVENVGKRLLTIYDEIA